MAKISTIPTVSSITPPGLSFQDIPTSLPLCFQGFPTSLPFRRGGPLGAVGIGFCGFPMTGLMGPDVQFAGRNCQKTVSISLHPSFGGLITCDSPRINLNICSLEDASIPNIQINSRGWKFQRCVGLPTIMRYTLKMLLNTREYV